MSGAACPDRQHRSLSETLIPKSLGDAAQYQLEHQQSDLSQPDLVFPAEILVHIFQDVFALRNADLETQQERSIIIDLETPQERSLRSASSSISSPEPFEDWKALSLIRSCKLFASIAIPELYRNVILTSNNCLLKWLDFPRRESLASLQTMDLRFIRTERDNVPFSTNRVIRSQGLRYETDGNKNRWHPRSQYVVDLTGDGPDEPESWKRAHLPNVTTVKISQSAWNERSIPPMTLFDPTTLTVYGATLDRDVSDLFGQGGSSSLDRLILHCDLSGYSKIMRLGWADYGNPYRWRVPCWKTDLTLTIGWRRATSSRSVGNQERCYLMALEYIVPVLIESLQPREITISPYLEDGNHDFCFPACPPRDFEVRRTSRHHHPLSKIVFRSYCECHQGDATNLWDKFGEKLMAKCEKRK